MFTPNLILNVEFMCGSTIEEAAVEAIEFAKKMECNIVFNFNGIKLLAYPTLKPKSIIDEYYSRIKTK